MSEAVVKLHSVVITGGGSRIGAALAAAMTDPAHSAMLVDAMAELLDGSLYPEGSART